MAAGLWAQQRMLPLDSPLYDEIDRLALEQGQAVPFASKPWSESEAKYYMELLGGVYPERSQQASFQDDQVSLVLSSQISLEGYLKTNWESSEGEYSVPWLYDYGDRLGLITIGSDIYLGERVYLGWDVELRQEHLADQLSDNYSNLRFNFDYYDVNFPFLAYGAYGGQNWTLFAGRGDLVLGPGISGQLVVSDNPDYLDQLRFSLWSRHFKYTGAMLYIQPYLSEAEQNLEAAYQGIDVDDLYDNKYIIFHRFDLLFFNRWNVGITEGLSWGGRTLDIRFFNPFILMHNFYEWDYAASLFSLDSQVTLAPGLQVYGQYMFNAITTPYEVARYGAEASAPAAGWMIGTQYLFPQPDENTADVSIGLEFVHTDPWLYTRETALTSFTWRRRELSNLEGGKPLITESLGYSWGNDTNLAMLWLHAGFPQAGLIQLHVDGSLSYVQDGEHGLTDYLYESDDGDDLTVLWDGINGDSTPSGTAEHYLILSASPSVDLQLGDSQKLTFSANSDMIMLWNAGHISGQKEFDAQLALGITWSMNR